MKLKFYGNLTNSPLTEEINKSLKKGAEYQAKSIEKAIKNFNIPFFDMYRLRIIRKQGALREEAPWIQVIPFYSFLNDTRAFSPESVTLVLTDRHRWHYFLALKWWLSMWYYKIKLLWKKSRHRLESFLPP